MSSNCGGVALLLVQLCRPGRHPRRKGVNQPTQLGDRELTVSLLLEKVASLTDKLTLEAVVLLVAFNRLSDSFRFMFSQDTTRVTSPSS